MLLEGVWITGNIILMGVNLYLAALILSFRQISIWCVYKIINTSLYVISLGHVIQKELNV